MHLLTTEVTVQNHMRATRFDDDEGGDDGVDNDDDDDVDDDIGDDDDVDNRGNCPKPHEGNPL